MKTTTEKTEAFVSESIADIFDEVINSCIPRGLYYFRASMSWDDTKAFDLETTKEIERTKWRYRGEGFDPEIRYLRYARWCLMFSDESSMFSGPHTGDIRETPVSFCGYEISCSLNGRGGYTGSVDSGLDSHDHGTEKGNITGPSSKVVAERIRSLFDVRTPNGEKQVEELLKSVNQAREAAGLELLTRDQVGLGTGIVLTFPST